jgi:energy-coupling factor transport system permease protein
MDRLNPGFKFLAILILGILLSFSFNARVNLGVFGASLALTLASSNLNYKKFFAWLSLFVLAAAGFFMTGLFFAKDSAPGELRIWGIATISADSLETAVQLSTRILAFGALALLFALTTKPPMFFRSLNQQFGAPLKFTYGIMAATGFIPAVRDEYYLVRAAVAVRGVRAGPFSPRRFMPMLVRAFRRAESASMAMESRGFNPLAERGSAFPVPLGAMDFVFLVCFPGAAALGLIFL